MRDREMKSPPNDDYCCVCHGDFDVPVQANCSHWFCGNCILLVWHHKRVLEPCECPMCRRLITLLTPSHTSLQQCNDPEVGKVLEAVEHYNHIFGRCTCSLFKKVSHIIRMLSPVDIFREGIWTILQFLDDWIWRILQFLDDIFGIQPFPSFYTQLPIGILLLSWRMYLRWFVADSTFRY